MHFWKAFGPPPAFHAELHFGHTGWNMLGYRLGYAHSNYTAVTGDIAGKEVARAHDRNVSS